MRRPEFEQRRQSPRHPWPFSFIRFPNPVRSAVIRTRLTDSASEFGLWHIAYCNPVVHVDHPAQRSDDRLSLADPALLCSSAWTAVSAVILTRRRTVLVGVKMWAGFAVPSRMGPTVTPWPA